MTPRVFRSEDGGATWTVLLTATGARHIHQVTIDPYHADRIYVTVGDIQTGATYRSEDDGQTWSVLGHGTSFWQPTATVFTPHYRVLGMDNTGGAIYRTADDKDYVLAHARTGARNWLWGQDNAGILLFGCSPPSNGGQAYIAASTDEGANWQTVYDFGAVQAWSGGCYASNAAPDGWIYCGDGSAEHAIRLRVTRR
jgi:hypothetical protein